MQRNSMRQEKEAAAAAAGNASPGWAGGEMGAFQQDKAHRAPPPYPQVDTHKVLNQSCLISLKKHMAQYSYVSIIVQLNDSCASKPQLSPVLLMVVNY